MTARIDLSSPLRKEMPRIPSHGHWSRKLPGKHSYALEIAVQVQGRLRSGASPPGFLPHCPPPVAAKQAVTALTRPSLQGEWSQCAPYYILLACVGLSPCAVKSIKHTERLWFTATFAVFCACDGLARLFAQPWMGIFSGNRKRQAC